MKKVFLCFVLCLISFATMNAQQASVTEVALPKYLSHSSFDLSEFGMWGHVITVNLGTEGVSGTEVFTGNGNYLSIAFMRSAPRLVAGTYPIVSFEEVGENTVLAGFPAMDGSGNWGSVWGTVTNNQSSNVQITSGVVRVTVNEDVFTIVLEGRTQHNNEIRARFTGRLGS